MQVCFLTTQNVSLHCKVSLYNNFQILYVVCYKFIFLLCAASIFSPNKKENLRPLTGK
uniref:Uncharacterized protein n=1 Tax=Anguilla anguilla TaxID=7936 RepID=A0A0E9S2G2_ANGAN